MRATFTLGLVATLVCLTLVQESAAHGRRCRCQCTVAYCGYPTTPPPDIKPPGCSCGGTSAKNSCTIDCSPNPCYAYKDAAGYCHCGCVPAGEPAGSPTFKFTVPKSTPPPRITLMVSGMTAQQFSDHWGIVTDQHDENFLNSGMGGVNPTKTLNFEVSGTIQDIISAAKN